MARKNKKGTIKRNILIVIGLFIVAVIFLFSEINMISKTAKQKEISENNENQQQESKKPKERIEFDTFVENADYDKDELEKINKKTILDIYNNSKIIDRKLEYDRIYGSSNTIKNAEKHVCNQLKREEKIVNSYNSEEEEVYYIVNVNYSLKKDTSKNSDMKVLVFKDEYYNAINNTFFIEDEKVVKLILDIEYYLKNKSNIGRKLIKSFIEEDDSQLIYTIYCIDFTYDQEDIDNYIQFVKEIKKIDKSSSKLVSTEKEILSEKITI